MLILIVFLPATFAFNPKVSDDQTGKWLNKTEQTLKQIKPADTAAQNKINKMVANIEKAKTEEGNKEAAKTTDKFKFRKSVQKVAADLKKFADDKKSKLQPQVKEQLKVNLKTWKKLRILRLSGLS